MQKKELDEDFTYLYNTLKLHPSFCIDADISEFEKRYEQLRSGVVDYMSLVNAMTELTIFFKTVIPILKYHIPCRMSV